MLNTKSLLFLLKRKSGKMNVAIQRRKKGVG